MFNEVIITMLTNRMVDIKQEIIKEYDTDFVNYNSVDKVDKLVKKYNEYYKMLKSLEMR